MMQCGLQLVTCTRAGTSMTPYTCLHCQQGEVSLIEANSNPPFSVARYYICTRCDSTYDESVYPLKGSKEDEEEADKDCGS